ncbi:MAG: ribonuclease BN [Ignavibacteria bacterium RBG_16_34_14]|nr:MAG: ribonuclease BN [Ignavibacteria bacterium RBG_16_34_14]
MAIKLNFGKIWQFIKDVFNKWLDDKAPKLGAALSFYTIFSLAPLLIIVISVAGFIFGPDAARGELVGQIEDLVGREGAEVVQTALKNTNDPKSGIIAIVVSLITLVIGSTAVFVELQESLDIIWRVKPKPGRNIFRGLLADRVQSFALVVATGFLLLVSLLVSTAIAALSNFVNERLLAVPIYVLDIANLIISFGVIFILFAMIYKVLPDVNLGWKDVWVGAMVTTVLFVLGKYLIGLYIGSSSLGSTYGAAGSLVIFLLWIYYSAQILFLGVEFTYIYTVRYGSGIKPSKRFMIYEINPITHDGG